MHKESNRVILIDPKNIELIATYCEIKDGNDHHPLMLATATGKLTVLIDRLLQGACLQKDEQQDHSQVVVLIQLIGEESVPFLVIEQLQ